MKITELSEICNVSRQTIYNNIKEGLSKEEILKKYTMPIKQEYENIEDQIIEDLKEIKRIVAKMVLEYQESLSRDIKFSDVAAIYEIVKKY